MPRIPSARTATLAGALLALSTLGAPALAQRDGGPPDSLYTREHYIKAAHKRWGRLLKTEPRTLQPFPVDRPQPAPSDDVDALFDDVIRKSAGWSR